MQELLGGWVTSKQLSVYLETWTMSDILLKSEKDNLYLFTGNHFPKYVFESQTFKLYFAFSWYFRTIHKKKTWLLSSSPPTWPSVLLRFTSWGVWGDGDLLCRCVLQKLSLGPFPHHSSIIVVWPLSICLACNTGIVFWQPCLGQRQVHHQIHVHPCLLIIMFF